MITTIITALLITSTDKQCIQINVHKRKAIDNGVSFKFRVPEGEEYGFLSLQHDGGSRYEINVAAYGVTISKMPANSKLHFVSLQGGDTTTYYGFLESNGKLIKVLEADSRGTLYFNPVTKVIVDLWPKGFWEIHHVRVNDKSPYAIRYLNWDSRNKLYSNVGNENWKGASKLPTKPWIQIW